MRHSAKQPVHVYIGPTEYSVKVKFIGLSDSVRAEMPYRTGMSALIKPKMSE
jgi:hypothetical protein